MEYWDIYDEKKQKTGRTMKRNDWNMKPDEITVYRICNAVKPQFCKNIFHVHTKASKLCPVGRNIRAVLQHSYSKFESALEDSLKTVTLADMIRDYHMQLEKEK